MWRAYTSEWMTLNVNTCRLAYSRKIRLKKQCLTILPLTCPSPFQIPRHPLSTPQTFFSCSPKWSSKLTVDKCCQFPRCKCCTSDSYAGIGKTYESWVPTPLQIMHTQTTHQTQTIKNTETCKCLCTFCPEPASIFFPWKWHACKCQMEFSAASQQMWRDSTTACQVSPGPAYYEGWWLKNLLPPLWRWLPVPLRLGTLGLSMFISSVVPVYLFLLSLLYQSIVLWLLLE